MLMLRKLKINKTNQREYIRRKLPDSYSTIKSNFFDETNNALWGYFVEQFRETWDFEIIGTYYIPCNTIQ